MKLKKVSGEESESEWEREGEWKSEGDEGE